jgi:hypothetical protein
MYERRNGVLAAIDAFFEIISEVPNIFNVLSISDLEILLRECLEGDQAKATHEVKQQVEYIKSEVRKVKTLAAKRKRSYAKSMNDILVANGKLRLSIQEKLVKISDFQSVPIDLPSVKFRDSLSRDSLEIMMDWANNFRLLSNNLKTAMSTLITSDRIAFQQAKLAQIAFLRKCRFRSAITDLKDEIQTLNAQNARIKHALIMVHCWLPRQKLRCDFSSRVAALERRNKREARWDQLGGAKSGISTSKMLKNVINDALEVLRRKEIEIRERIPENEELSQSLTELELSIDDAEERISSYEREKVENSSSDLNECCEKSLRSLSGVMQQIDHLRWLRGDGQTASRSLL